MTILLRHRRLLAIVPALLALIAAIVIVPPPVSAAGPPVAGAACAPGAGVTVVVDYQGLGGVEIGCAPGAQTDGFAALANAGFTINESGGPVAGTVCQIRSVPAAGHPSCWYSGFWAYWKSDGAAPWGYSQTGASAGPLAVDRVEAWSWTSPVPADYSGTLPRVGVADLADHVPVVQAPQTIDFAALPDAALGGSAITLSATASSALPVAFAATGQCSVTGSTLTLTAAGSCTVTASEPGNAQWLAASPVARTFAITAAPDLTAPVVTITSAPSGITSATTASILYSVDDATATVEYRLDGGTWATATSPIALSGLAVGAHTAQLRATDPASNVGTASASWNVSGARDCATGPLIPDLGVLDFRDVLPVRSDDGNAVEVGVLTDLDASPSTASYAIATQVDLGAYIGQKVRVVARIASDPCASAPTFDAVYDVRAAYVPRWSLTTAPGAPSEVLASNSPSIKAWPSSYENYTPGPNVTAGFKNPSSVVGKTGLVVLGDHGTIDLVFAQPIADGPGGDLAVFENGFSTGAAAAQLDFLEFGRVAVSSDGVHWATFDSASRRTALVGAFAGQSAAEIGGLAGKDLSGRGTPFDLVNLRNQPEVRSGLVDLTWITRVRIIDVLGDGSDKDSFGRPIYDPTPTAGSGGFDLTGLVALNLAPAPLLAITSAPAALTGATTASIAFAVQPATGLTVECRLDAGEFAACTSPYSVSALTDGAHAAEVRTRWSEAADWLTRSASWTVDTTAPAVGIASAPAGITAATAASIAFTVDDGSATVQYRLDGGAWASAASPISITGLAPGKHLVEVRAADAIGNAGTASAAWTVSGPRSCLVGPSMPDLGILDGRDVLPVGSPDLHAVEVAVLTDPAADPSSAVYVLTDALDLSQYTGQKVRVLARVAGDLCTAAPTFDAVYDVRAAYAPRWNSTGLPGGPSPAISGASPLIKAWPSSYESYAPGTNVSGSFKNPSSVVGGTGLVVLGDHGTIDLRFDAPIADGPGYDLSVMENGFAYGAVDFLEVARIAVSSDGVHWATFDSASRRTAPVGAFVGQDPAELGGLAGKDLAGQGTPFDLVNLRNSAEVRAGLVDLGFITHVRIVDVVGDGSDLDSFGRPIYDPTPTTGSGGFDLTGVAALNLAPAPVVELTSGPEELTRETAATVAFTVSPAEGSEIACRLDAGEWAQCAAPFSVDSLTDGMHTIEVRARWNDDFEWATQSVSWVVDARAPLVTLISAPAALSALTTATVAFTVDDPAAAVACSVDGAPEAPCASPLLLSGLADGAHSVTVTATDAAGNTGRATAGWVVEQPAPAAAGLSTDSAHVGDQVTATGSGFEPGEQVTITLHSAPQLLATVVADGSGSVSHTFAVPQVDAGAHSVVLAGLASGRTASAPLSVLADDPAPGTQPGPASGPAAESEPGATGPATPLARTGADAAGLALIGALLLLVGAAAAWAARRRTGRGIAG